MQKQTLLIVIDNLKKGGAEILLVGILSDLNKIFDVILVTLSDECDFSREKISCKKRYSLDFKNKYSLFTSVSKLKKIIKKDKPSLIHSHLFYSSVIARMSCPDDIPLIYSLHNEMSKNVFNGSKFLTFLEKKTIKKNHSLIAVSKKVLEDYEKIITKMNRAFVLHNYVSNEYFTERNIEKKIKPEKEITLIAIGNIKKQKNYTYLLKALKNLKNYPVTIDIYGEGNDKEMKTLQDEIDKNKLPVFLKGATNNLQEILPRYDLFVSSSTHEGFGISAVEAMASGLPLLLSDLPVFHEITSDNALFFDVYNPMSFVELISEIFENKHDLSQLSNKGIDISKKYTKEIYIEKLFKIYASVLKRPLINSPLVNA
jgi:glycosyltransferase involved in cell wall biosynthesis